MRSGLAAWFLFPEVLLIKIGHILVVFAELRLGTDQGVFQLVVFAGGRGELVEVLFEFAQVFRKEARTR